MAQAGIRGVRRDYKAITARLIALSLAATLVSCGGTGSGLGGRSAHQTLTSLLISPANPVVGVGDSERFVAVGVFADGSSQEVTSAVNWSSENEKVASIDPTGLASARQSGSTRISVTWGELNATTSLTVPDATLVSIAVHGSAASVAKGGFEQLAAIGTFTDGTTKDLTSSSTWVSETPAVASVNAAGLVTGAGIGTATITATSGKIRGAETLKVAQSQLISLSVTPVAVALAKGRTQQLAVTGGFSDGSTADVTGTVTWTISPASVGAISSAGVVSALAVGNATITAISGPISGSATLSVSAPVLASMAITPSNPSIKKGSTQQLIVTGTFSDASVQNLTNSVAWTVSSTAVATVSNSGVLNAAGTGTATVTATSGSINASDAITVVAPSLTSIAIAPASPSIPKGESQQLTATGTYSDGSTQDISSQVTWSDSAVTIASVSSTGLVAAQTVGASNITATLGSVSASDTITVGPPVVVSIAVTPAKSSITQIDTEQMRATGTFSDGSKQNITQTVTWATGDLSIASVNNSGLLTPGQVGATTITAMSGQVTGTATLKVTSAVLVSIAIDPGNPSVPLGTTGQLKAIGKYSDGSTQELTSQVAWISLQPAIATINATGVDAGKSRGVTTITATLGSVARSVTLTVTAPLLTSLAVSPAHSYLAMGGTAQLKAIGGFSDGSTQDITTQTSWSSSSTQIAIVNTAGVASGQGSGTATITAQSGAFFASVYLVVAPVSIGIVPANFGITTGTMVHVGAVATFSDGSTSDVTASVTWSVADPHIAAIVRGGLMGLQIGTTTLSATAGPVSASTTIFGEPVKFVDYFDQSHSSGPDGTLRISNTGFTGGNLCAMVYVFAADQQLSECCGCQVTPNGLRTLSLNTDLTANPLTGHAPTRGTVEVVPAEVPANSICDPTSYIPSGSLKIWSTHIQASTPGSFATTETNPQVALLSNLDLPTVQAQCEFLNMLGSGQGTCTCGTGD